MNVPRFVWLLGGWLALTLIGAFGVALPTLRTFQDLRREAAELQGRIAREEDGAAQVRRLEVELEQLKSRASLETKPIPRDSDVAGLIRELSGELTRLGLMEREITTGAPTTVGKVRSLPMLVTLYGDFPSVNEAVGWIERLPRLVRVQRVRVEVDNRKKPPAPAPTPAVAAGEGVDSNEVPGGDAGAEGAGGSGDDARLAGLPVKAELMLDVYFDPDGEAATAGGGLADASEEAGS